MKHPILTVLAMSASAGALSPSYASNSKFETIPTSSEHIRLHQVEATSQKSVSALGAQAIQIHARVGRLILETAQTDRVLVSATRWSDAPNTAMRRKWMSVRVGVRSWGRVVSVDDAPRDWSPSMAGKFGLLLRITVPPEFEASLNLKEGKVTTFGAYKTVRIDVGAGVFDGWFRLSSRGPSSVHVGAGSIDLHVPRDSNLGLVTSIGIGKISGVPAATALVDDAALGDRRTESFGSAGSNLTANVGVGEIVVSSETHEPLRAFKPPHRPFRLRYKTLSALNDVPAPQLEPRIRLSPVVEPDSHPQKVEELKELDAVEQTKDSDERDANETAATQLRNEAQKDRLFDADLKELDKVLAKELAQIQPEIQRALAGVRPEIEKALREARPEIERGLNEKLKKQQHRELERAVKQAKSAMDMASKQFAKDGKLRRLMSEDLRKQVEAAMFIAREAIEQSMQSLRDSESSSPSKNSPKSKK